MTVKCGSLRFCSSDGKEFVLAFIRWPRFNLHMPFMSDWCLASSPGQVTATLGTPEVRFSLDRGNIRILLSRMDKG